MDPRLTARLPDPRPGSCSADWADTGTPAWGTASVASFWVALEQPGPWGGKAFGDSRLDPEIGLALESACAEAGGRALLIRGAGEHAVAREDQVERRRLYVAGGASTGRPWLLAADITDPRAVLNLPFAVLAGGDPAPAIDAVPGLRREDGGILLVCTNAKRDACCALLGRPVAVLAGAVRPGQVWECTHTGGHRFAPTGIALPSGATFAHLTPETAVEAVDLAPAIPASLLTPATLRGLAHLAPAAQAADAHVRVQTSATHPADLTTTVGSAANLVTVAHADGRTWTLTVHHEVDESDLRKNSCVKPPVPADRWIVSQNS